MAASRCVYICEPLCFAIGRFGQLDEKKLKQVLVDFYDAVSLAVAKNRLSEDIEKLNPANWTRPSQHREGEKRATLEVDDIFQMINFLDQNLLLDNAGLPIYVCENVDRIPSSD
jgi:hypothetical protein